MNIDINDILENLDDKLDCEGEEMNDEMKSKIKDMTMEKINGERKHIRYFKKVFIAVAAAVIALTATVCATVYHYSKDFDNYFGKASDDSANVSSAQLTAKDEYKGIKVQGKEIIGDGYGCYVMYQVTLDKKINQEKIVFQDEEIEVNKNSYQVTDSKLVNKKDNVYDYVIGIRTSDNLRGANCVMKLSNPGYYDSNGKFVKLCKHSFKLHFKLVYDNAQANIKVNKNINIYGGKASWDNVVISPLSVTVFLSEKKNFSRNASSMKNAEQINDRLIVKFKDGTIRDSYNVTEDYDVFNDTTIISLGFNQIISPSKIESITFAGKTIKVNIKEQETK